MNKNLTTFGMDSKEMITEYLSQVLSDGNKDELLVTIENITKTNEPYDLMEHTEIYKLVQLRKNSKTISFEDSASKYGIDLNAL